MHVSPETLAILTRWAASRPDVARCWVFGSRAGSLYRGRGPTPTSDLDVAVELAIAPEAKVSPSGVITAAMAYEEAVTDVLACRSALSRAIGLPVRIAFVQSPPLSADVRAIVEAGPAILVVDKHTPVT